MVEARIVDWYRADVSRRMVGLLVTGAATMGLGGFVVAVSFVTRQPERVREYAMVVGLVLVASSATFTSVAMQRLLRQDVSLVIRTDGLCINDAQGAATVVPWTDLTRARWDATRGVLVIERADAEPVVVAWAPAGISGPDLAARIERERQRAAMGLLR